MKHMTIKKIKKNQCTGCGACMNICPENAISMQYDDEGFLFPIISDEACTNCSLCYNKCPAVNPTYKNNASPECYASWAENDIRLTSSSGGVFTLLAKHFWNINGAVAGAVFADDYRSVRHIVTRNPEDLRRLQTSKYLQSNTEYVYREVSKLLKENVPVLFVGTPCQVAALKSIIGDHKLLLTVDIACKSVPSTRAYNYYLDEISHGRELESVAFRDKSLWGWSASFRAKFKDGTQYFKAEWLNEPFYKGFLGLIINRKSCGECPFAKIPRQGDITLADFWGIHKKDQSWDDRYGTSLLLINNPKGQSAFKQITHKLKRTEKMDTAFAIANNPALERPLPQDVRRDRFFKLLPQKGYTAALKDVVENRYDAGIIGFWIGTNYGTILTNYALNNVLKDQGLSVCMIDPCSGPPRDTDYPIYYNHRKEFEAKHYNIIAEPDLTKLNEHITTFVIGSDQVWNYELSKNFGHVMFLDFVSDENRKISYAASFGDDVFNNNGEYRRVASYNMRRFDAVSVRESQGVDICREQFGVEATHVMDPVFLCDRSRYDILASDSALNIKEPYLFAYILDPTPQKRNILINTAKAMNLKPVVVLDCEPWRYEQHKKNMRMDAYVLDNIFVEDFVKLLSMAKAVITDSFHGTAFSVIYEKPFVAIANPERGFARFESLLSMLKLSERLVYPYGEYDLPYRIQQLKTDIPKETMDLIVKEVIRSKEWLNTALFADRNPNHTMIADKIYAQGCANLRLAHELKTTKEELKETQQLLQNVLSKLTHCEVVSQNTINSKNMKLKGLLSILGKK